MTAALFSVGDTVVVESVESLRRLRSWAGPRGWWPLVGRTGTVVHHYDDGLNAVEISVSGGRHTYPLADSDLTAAPSPDGAQ